jgi:lipopolysaccharide transport system ATP-binding protein
MMGKIIVSKLGKAYKKYPSQSARFAEALLPEYGDLHTTHWVLRGINFVIEPGEAVGIMGINGAGKSTLLKILAGTVIPSEGLSHVHGQVAAILELGMGFHPDFTGRQNVFMAGQLLGFKTHEIAYLMPEIEAFAEIGQYMDQPVRVYSSGMQMRLAFSVATASRPDVLLIDEALSVGDTYFQHKSFDRIRQYRAKGTTLLIVSHDKAAIQSICDRAILLNDGKLTMEDRPEAVMDYYNALLADRENHHIELVTHNDGKTQAISGSGEVTILAAELLDESNQPIKILMVGQYVTLMVKIRTNQNIDGLVIGYSIKDRLGQIIFGTNTHHLSGAIRHLKVGKEVHFLFRFSANLGLGAYSIAIAAHRDDVHIGQNYVWQDLAILFTVISSGEPTFIGSNWIPPVLEVVQ